jgi:hypothetical protein
MTTDDKVSWWSSTGWLRGVRPQELVRVETQDDISAAMENEGYQLFRATEEDAALNYELWKHDSGHLVVEIWMQSSRLELFCVASPNVAAFLTDKLPAMLQGSAAREGIERDRRALKTLIAFVRYGHGMTTVDRSGERDPDDTAEERERMKWLQSQRAKAATTA